MKRLILILLCLYSVTVAAQETRFKKYLREADSLRKVSEAEEAAEAKRAQRAAIEQRKKNKLANERKKQQRETALVKKYGYDNASLISAGHVKIGMTTAMCMDAWGKPYTINRTTNAAGVREQWVYNLKSYLYFDNGILTTIQN